MQYEQLRELLAFDSMSDNSPVMNWASVQRWHPKCAVMYSCDLCAVDNPVMPVYDCGWDSLSHEQELRLRNCQMCDMRSHLESACRILTFMSSLSAMVASSRWLVWWKWEFLDCFTNGSPYCEASTRYQWCKNRLYLPILRCGDGYVVCNACWEKYGVDQPDHDRKHVFVKYKRPSLGMYTGEGMTANQVRHMTLTSSDDT